MFIWYYCFNMKKKNPHKTKNTKFNSALTPLKFCMWHWGQTLPLKFCEQSSKNPNPIHCCHTGPQTEYMYTPIETIRPRRKHQSLRQLNKISTHFHVVMAAHCLPVSHMDVLWKGLEAQDSIRLHMQALQLPQVCSSQTSERRCCSTISQLRCPDIQNSDEHGSFHCWQSSMSWVPFAGT